VRDKLIEKIFDQICDPGFVDEVAWYRGVRAY
jgi:hypothetical protein